MSYKKNINWRHMLLHLLALWTMQKLGTHVAFLINSSYLENLKSAVNGEFPHGELVDQHLQMMLLAGYCAGGALLVGFILSMTLTILRRWFWLNSLLAMILMIGLSILVGYTGFYPFGPLLNPSRIIFDSVIIQQLFFVALFLALSSILFFLPLVNRWIANGYTPAHEQPKFQFEDPQ